VRHHVCEGGRDRGVVGRDDALCLTRLPLILAAQVMVGDWPLPATLKFMLICSTVTGVLLVAYHKMVRLMWVGRMLNGPRKLRAPAAQRSPTSPTSLETTGKGYSLLSFALPVRPQALKLEWPPPIHSPRTTTGRCRMARPSRQSS
jgi:hypothetical protein